MMTLFKRRKVMVVITARPSYSRIKTVLIELNKRKNVELQIVLAASAHIERFGDITKIVESDGLKIVKHIYSTLDGGQLKLMPDNTAILLLQLSNAMRDLEPDVVVTIADRYETIATSISASYLNIPLIHFQGGEVTGNIDEKVRHANTKLADIHIVSNEDSKLRVLKLGEYNDSVHNLGCPSIDIAKKVLDGYVRNTFDPFEYAGVGFKSNAWKSGYCVVLIHPTTTNSLIGLSDVNELIKAIKIHNMPIFWFWPNIDAGTDQISKRLRSARESGELTNAYFFKNMKPEDFLKLLIDSKLLIGNSSVGIRECSYLGVPVVNIGDRQNSRLRGSNVIDCDGTSHSINSAIKDNYGRKYNSEFIYGDGHSGIKIAELISNIELKLKDKIAY